MIKYRIYYFSGKSLKSSVSLSVIEEASSAVASFDGASGGHMRAVSNEDSLNTLIPGKEAWVSGELKGLAWFIEFVQGSWLVVMDFYFNLQQISQVLTSDMHFCN